MNSEVLVKAEGVRKKFCRSLKRSLLYGLSDMAAEVLGGRTTYERLRTGEFWAVDDVSFELRRGECLGLIGRNGAGKTTLLKMLNGLIKPDAGRITMRGRVGALIALGAGFNPILTGRENIYVNGSVLGLSKKEIDAKLDDIIDFAEIHDFIDTPVQSYSSGMQVRLGFAIATAIDPEILLLDEVLAVGDMAFRIKCYNRIGRLQKNAATILVTHSMSQVSIACNRILFMSHGKGDYYTNHSEGIQRYIVDQTATASEGETKPILTFTPPIDFASIEIESPRIQHGDDIAIVVTIDSSDYLNNLQLQCSASTEDGNPILMWNGDWKGHSINLKPGRQTIRLVLGPIHLTAGKYAVYVILRQPGNGQLFFYSHRSIFFELIDKEIFGEIHNTFGLRELVLNRDEKGLRVTV